MIYSADTALNQLQIKFANIVDLLHDGTLAQYIPRSLPPTPFADDTCMPIRVPRDRKAAQEFKQLLHDLKDVTGLKVNPTKSELILLFDDPTAEQRKILSESGTIKNHVTHLGVVIAKDYATARKLTYDTKKLVLKKTSSQVSSGISSMNVLLKAEAVNTVVSAVNNHRFHVYPPTLQEVEDQ